MVLAAFLVGLGLSIAGLVVVIVRGLGLWRVARRTGGLFQEELALFEERSARTERLLSEADTSSRELEVALARVRSSTARLRVLKSGLERSLARLRWVRALVPGL